MNLEIIIIGIVVGLANFISRFSPFLFLQYRNHKSHKKSNIWITVAIGSIGISAICSMLMVATLPSLIDHPDRILAVICGFIILTIVYLYSKNIVLSTLVSSLSYGIIFTYLPY